MESGGSFRDREDAGRKLAERMAGYRGESPIVFALPRGDRPQPEVEGRTAILVDDGLATGVTARAAVEALRRRNPGRLVLAVPVCAAQSVELLRPEVDELVRLEAPSNLMAISLWYQDFLQVEDEEVVELLERARRER
jgi:putative phosphoribosyl transferase